LINPFVSYIEKKLKLSRLLATTFVILIVFILSTGALLLIITEIIQGTFYLSEKVPSHYHYFFSIIKSLLNSKVSPIHHKFVSFFQSLNITQQSKIYEYIENFTNYLASTGASILRDLLLKIPNFLSVFPYSFTITILIFIATFLITKDWDQLKKIISNIIPLPMKKMIKDVMNSLEKSLLGYIKAQLILMFVTAIIITIGLLILKIDHAISIAFIIALIDIIPLIGIGIVFIPWIIYLFFMKSYSLTISISILYIVIIIVRQIIEPKILATNIGLSPLTALIILFIGIQLWGVSGIIIA